MKYKVVITQEDGKVFSTLEAEKLDMRILDDETVQILVRRVNPGALHGPDELRSSLLFSSPSLPDLHCCFGMALCS